MFFLTWITCYWTSFCNFHFCCHDIFVLIQWLLPILNYQITFCTKVEVSDNDLITFITSTVETNPAQNLLISVAHRVNHNRNMITLFPCPTLPSEFTLCFQAFHTFHLSLPLVFFSCFFHRLTKVVFQNCLQAKNHSLLMAWPKNRNYQFIEGSKVLGNIPVHFKGMYRSL